MTTTVHIKRHDGQQLVILTSPDLPEDLRCTVAGRIIGGAFQPSPLAYHEGWGLGPDVLHDIANHLETPDATR